MCKEFLAEAESTRPHSNESEGAQPAKCVCAPWKWPSKQQRTKDPVKEERCQQESVAIVWGVGVAQGPSSGPPLSRLGGLHLGLQLEGRGLGPQSNWAVLKSEISSGWRIPSLPPATKYMASPVSTTPIRHVMSSLKQRVGDPTLNQLPGIKAWSWGPRALLCTRPCPEDRSTGHYLPSSSRELLRAATTQRQRKGH